MPLGVVACRLLASDDGFVERPLAAQVARDLGHADRAHDRQVWRQAASQQGLDFLDRAACRHALEPQVTAGVEPFARRQKHQRLEVYRAADAASALRLPMGQRLSGRADHLERAGDALRVAGL